MSLERVKADLDTMREAAGFGLPFQRGDVTFCLALGSSGALLAAAYAAGARATASVWLAASPFLGIGVAYLAWMIARSRRRGREPIARRREYRAAWVLAPLSIAAIVGLRAWAGAWGMPVLGVYCLLLIGVGCSLMAIPLYDPKRLAYGACGVPMVIAGLAAPFCSPHGVFVAIVGAAALAAFTMAGVMATQLWIAGSIEKRRG